MKRLISLLLFVLNIYISTAQVNKEDEDEVFTIAEEMPYLKMCDSLYETYKEKKTCSDKQLLSYFYNNLTLDSTDVYYSDCCNSAFSFIVTKEGKIEELTIIKSINQGFDARLIEILKKMPEWVPGKTRGKNVNIKIRLPLKIKPSSNW